MNSKLIDAARSSFPAADGQVVLGAVLDGAASHPEPLVRVSPGMLNRHGLIAGATGTGKTKTLQLMAEQLAELGVPVFLADVKGDLTGLSVPGESNERVRERVTQTGATWGPAGFPVEFLSLSGTLGAPVRATISSFGPLLLGKVLGLNETQASVLTLVFQYCDDRGLLLLDLADLRAALQYLTNEGVADLKEYGSISKQSVSVILRKLVELDAQGAEAFFGEPEFDPDDLFVIDSTGHGQITVLELRDVQDRPALFSTFLLWLLARLYNELPEVGDLEKPKLVFFFDEAHLLFEDASKALKAQIEQVVRLIRSKGVGVIFITQSPKDIPADVLGQLGNRVQHALRAFTPDDEKNLRAAARTFPKSEFYDIQQTLTSLGTGEALVTVLTERGTPTPTFATRLIPPRSRMGTLSDPEFQSKVASSKLMPKYRDAVDRDSARERLAARAAEASAAGSPAPADPGRATRRRQPKEPPSALETIVKSPMARTVAGAVTRGLMGALLGRRR